MEWINDVTFWREGCFLLFLWIFWWAYSGKRREEFDEINAIFLSEDDSVKNEGKHE